MTQALIILAITLLIGVAWIGAYVLGTRYTALRHRLLISVAYMAFVMTVMQASEWSGLASHLRADTCREACERK